MAVTIVWLNQELAKIYHFAEDRMERAVLRCDEGHSIVENLPPHLESSAKVLVLSPGRWGDSFVGFLRARYPQLARKIIGNERLETAVDAEIAEYAIKYFQRPVIRSVS